MIITKETDYALRILRVLLDGEKHSVAEMSETELIPTQFAYQILRKLSAGNLVQVQILNVLIKKSERVKDKQWGNSLYLGYDESVPKGYIDADRKSVV